MNTNVSQSAFMAPEDGERLRFREGIETWSRRVGGRILVGRNDVVILRVASIPTMVCSPYEPGLLSRLQHGLTAWQFSGEEKSSCDRDILKELIRFFEGKRLSVSTAVLAESKMHPYKQVARMFSMQKVG
jgi:hypothetical protein